MNKQKLNLFSAFNPEQVFAYANGAPISFADFLSDVDALSANLVVNQGDVLISCQSRYAFSVALLASWKTGKVAVLLPNTNKEALTKVSNETAIAYSCDDAWAKTCRQTTCRSVDLADISVFHANQPAVRLYTSGSTGEPQVIEKTLGNLWFEVETLKETLNLLDSPLVASVPAYHLYGLTFSVLLPWCLGVALVDEMPLHADEVETCFKQTGAQILVTVPIHLKALMGAGVNLKQKRCIVSAAPMPKESAAVFRENYQSDAVEIYGSSETGIVAYRKQLVDEAWLCFPQVDIAVNEKSLLEISSPFVCEHLYDHNKGNVFCSSDKATLQGDKQFMLEGRMDAIIKIAGKRISLPNIEQCLMRCQGVHDAAVIAVPAESEVRDWAIWAVIAVADEEKCNLMAIKSELRKWLDGVAIPRRMVKVTNLPREANGKLPKKNLLELFSHV